MVDEPQPRTTTPRFCRTCGTPLTADLEAPSALQACPHCTRAWDPADPKSTSDTPPEPRRPSLLRSDTLARWSLLPLILIGRLTLNTLGITAATGLAAPPGDDPSDVLPRIGGAVIAVGVLLLAVPWLLLCGHLFLVALTDRVHLHLPAAILTAAGFYMLLLLGYPPAAWVAGVCLAPLTALLFVRGDVE